MQQEQLTPREIDIMRLVSQGYTNQAIADELVVTLGTVKWYTNQIYSKLGVQNRTEATLRVREMGLLDGGGATHAPAGPDSNLPTPLTPFIGREAELAALVELFQQARLVSIVGPGGIGKTRLALEYAARQQSKSVFVELAPVTYAEDVQYAIAAAMGFTLRDESDPRGQLLGYVADKTMLLVLDNFEHVIETRALAMDILQAAPAVTMLVTSRERLNLYGETVLTLEGLALDDPQQSAAVTLFINRARHADAGFEPGDLSHILAICQMLDGMPLGIELAASWIHTLTLAEIRAEIEQGLDILRTEMGGLDTRHRCMRAVFDSTWGRLAADEQAALMRLAVFRGGFERDAAQEVAGADLDLLASLLRKSVIRRDDAGRYDLHFLMREYAAEQLEKAGLTAEVRRHHAVFFRDLIRRLTANSDAPPKTIYYQVMARLDREIGNLREIMIWSCEHDSMCLGLELVGYCPSFLADRGHLAEGLHWTLKALDKCPHASVEALALAYHGAMFLAQRMGRERLIRELEQPALNAARQAGYGVIEAWMLNAVGHVAMHAGELDQAAAYFDQTQQLLEQSGDSFTVSSAKLSQALLQEYSGDLEAAADLMEEAIALAGRHANPHHTMNYARILLELSDFAQSQHFARLALADSVAGEDTLNLISTLQVVGALAWRRDDRPDMLVQLFGAVDDLRTRIGFTWHEDGDASTAGIVGAQALLEDPAYQDAWAAGKATSIDAAVALAWEVLGGPPSA